MVTTAVCLPRAAASAVVFRGERVLLVERHRGPGVGSWSFPGGHIEPGERAIEAARREFLEETGLTARHLDVLAVHDVIRRDEAGALAVHYVISVFWGEAGPGEPAPSAEITAARFVTLAEAEALPLTDGALALIRKGLDHRARDKRL